MVANELSEMAGSLNVDKIDYQKNIDEIHRSKTISREPVRN